MSRQGESSRLTSSRFCFHQLETFRAVSPLIHASISEYRNLLPCQPEQDPSALNRESKGRRLTSFPLQHVGAPFLGLIPPSSPSSPSSPSRQKQRFKSVGARQRETFLSHGEGCLSKGKTRKSPLREDGRGSETRALLFSTI